MGFQEAQSYLDSLGIDAMKAKTPSLARIEALCDALNHPELAVPAIHVTGTNGKTSTARIISSILAASGLTVGTYTSPHLQKVTERITRDGEPISEDEFGEIFDHLMPYVQHVEARLGEGLTYFEILTAMYFLWAAEAPVDASVIEVGLGGRWDATNVIAAPVAVITNIALDHTGMLGADRATIAKEKAGIIKSRAVVITSERHGEAATVIGSEAEAQGARLRILGQDFDLLANTIAVGGRYLSFASNEMSYEGLFLPLHGSHQGENAALAIDAAASFIPAKQIEQEVVAEGLARSAVPGRLEAIEPRSDARVVLDVAHNPDGMSACISSLVESFAFEKVTFVVGILADKDLEGMLRELARIPCRIVPTQAKSARSFSVTEIATVAEALALEHHAVEDVPEAVSFATGRADDTEIVCVTGSHYVVGEARSFLRPG